mmetsp:Transcript_147788/g.384249  ORF Transcript_147788/g.384249 Transcript_147788/m.384249 type:complete len:200 (+) Transcript_147788:225-824(+)
MLPPSSAEGNGEGAPAVIAIELRSTAGCRALVAAITAPSDEVPGNSSGCTASSPTTRILSPTGEIHKPFAATGKRVIFPNLTVLALTPNTLPSEAADRGASNQSDASQRVRPSDANAAALGVNKGVGHSTSCTTQGPTRAQVSLIGPSLPLKRDGNILPTVMHAMDVNHKTRTPHLNMYTGSNCRLLLEAPPALPESAS